MVLLAASGCGGGGGSTPPEATLVSITLAPSSLKLAVGTTALLSATGHYSDGSTRTMTSTVTWMSSDTKIALVNASGQVTAVAAGTATITASSGSITSDESTVTALSVISLTISPLDPVVDWGAKQPFTATATLSDASTQDVTEAAVWSSSLPSVATASNTTGSRGWVTTFDTGTTTITANWNGFSSSTSLTVNSVDNVMKVTVNGSLCAPNSYPNKPCVSVTICSPGTANCKTIPDILLDTGSMGLRVFRSLIADIPLTPVAAATGVLANCVQYVDETAHWDPVQIADVILGNEKASNVPILVIDATFGTIPTSCGTPDASPAESGFNGILGIGLFPEDCGATCASVTDNGVYFSCDASACSPTTASLSDQVKNPAALLPTDNNGVIVQFPSVDLGGLSSVDGIVIFGIGTRSNNSPSTVAASFATDSVGDFTTVFNGRTYRTSFMDTGSNGLFFNGSSLSSLIPCGDWYCPTTTLSLSATLAGFSVPFKIGNATTLFASGNEVFVEVGGPFSTFDWGLPFFLGRRVYVVIGGKSSALGIGPYLAY